MARTQVIGGKGSPEELDDNWIHWDKLAQIESRELEEAGLKFRGRASRSESRSEGIRSGSSSRTRRKERDNSHYSNDLNGEERPGLIDRRGRTISPIPADGEPDDEVEPFNPEIRTPEEIAADDEASSSPGSRAHIVRPSTSRIPIAKNSPAPVPNTFVERDAPLPRSRNGSGAWGGLEDGISFGRARGRSGSVGSQVLLDELDSDLRPQTPRTTPSSPNSSPPKKLPGPSKNAPTSKKPARVQSRNRNASGQQQQQQPQRESPNKRPTTSSGRPSTSHARPEGEAPWIATMYKPDPRLPPEQQMLPTHAKRLAQEQWEREGKTGSVYDREFRLLNTDDFSHLSTSSRQVSQEMSTTDGVKDDDSQLKPISQPDQRDSQQWPLPNPKNSNQSGNEHGGYSTIPRITSQNHSGQIRAPGSSTPQIQPKTTTTIQRVPDVSENEKSRKKEKGCCCIVM